jgi:hypothetical protein
MASAYSNLGVLQWFDPLNSATNSVSLPLSHMAVTMEEDGASEHSLVFGGDLAPHTLVTAPIPNNQ